MSMSLNRAMLIGHVTAAPDMRYTPQGTPVCTFNVATNRSWTDQATGARQESAEFTRCVAWRKLAEICSQVITKGRQVYVDGRLQTREWETQERGKQRTTELVLENMIALGPAGQRGPASSPRPAPDRPTAEDLGEFAKDETNNGTDDDKKEDTGEPKITVKKAPAKGWSASGGKPNQDPEVPPEDIPF